MDMMATTFDMAMFLSRRRLRWVYPHHERSPTETTTSGPEPDEFPGRSGSVLPHR